MKEDRLSIELKFADEKTGTVFGTVSFDYDLEDVSSSPCPRCGGKSVTLAPCNVQNIRVTDSFGNPMTKGTKLAYDLVFRAGIESCLDETLNPTICECDENPTLDADDSGLTLLIQLDD